MPLVTSDQAAPVPESGLTILVAEASNRYHATLNILSATENVIDRLTGPSATPPDGQKAGPAPDGLLPALDYYGDRTASALQAISTALTKIEGLV